MTISTFLLAAAAINAIAEMQYTILAMVSCAA